MSYAPSDILHCPITGLLLYPKCYQANSAILYAAMHSRSLRRPRLADSPLQPSQCAHGIATKRPRYLLNNPGLLEAGLLRSTN